MTETSNSNANSTRTVKFLYSYGGRIIPRPSDGKLRYLGGYTRVLSFDPSISFSELIVKFGESCGSSVVLKCKLPSEDLDVLVSIKSDEDLQNVIQEYERASPEAKIRAVLFPAISAKKVSPPSSPMSCLDFPWSRKSQRVYTPHAPRYYTAVPLCAPLHNNCLPAVGFGYPVAGREYSGSQRWSPRQFYYVPYRNHSH